jgi:hypothetical protein
MSMDERDWYQEEAKPRAHYQPPQHGYIHPELRHFHTGSRTSKAVIALAWVGVGAMLYLAFTLLGHYHKA